MFLSLVNTTSCSFVSRSCFGQLMLPSFVWINSVWGRDPNGVSQKFDFFLLKINFLFLVCFDVLMSKMNFKK